MGATTADHEEAHGALRADAIPDDPLFGAASPGKLAMWVFLLSDAFSFSGLLLTYGVLRGGARTWPPNPELHEPPLGINFTAGLTFVLVCSSVTMVLAHAASVEGNRKKLCGFLALTILGGALFLCGQAQEYFGVLHGLGLGDGLIKDGLVLGASSYANTFFVTTTFHGLHVLAGIVYLTVTLVRAALGRLGRGAPDSIEIAGLFWHFVDLVWILVFTFVYLVPSAPVASQG